MTWLEREVDAARGELARIDGKVTTLTAIATGVAAFSLSQAGHGPGVARAALLTAAGLFAAAVLILLAAIRPRLGNAGWCRHLTMGGQDLLHLDVRGRTPGPEPAGRPEAAHRGPAGLRRPGRRQVPQKVQLAVGLTMLAVVLLIAAAAAGAFP